MQTTFTADCSLQETRITPRSQASLATLAVEVWNYRELLTALVVRDLKVRYRQTVLGVLWVVLQPLIATSLLAFVWMRAGRGEATDWAATWWFFLAAFIPWQSFASAVQQAAASLEAGTNLISKVYFPRVLVPAALVIGATVDLTIALSLFLVAAGIAGVPLGTLLLVLPVCVLVQCAAALGYGAALAALHAQFRDVKYVLPFALQLALLVTLLLPVEQWPGGSSLWGVVHPLLGVVATYRAALAGTPLPLVLLGCSAMGASLALCGGVLFFRTREARLVDAL